MWKLNKKAEPAALNASVDLPNQREATNERAGKIPAVIILGPPWPRSGTARVIQSQIEYYRQRGFLTVFVVVPYCWAYRKNSSIWDELRDGINEIGADHVFIASLEERRYSLAKYTASIRNPFGRTLIDWWFAVGAAAQLSSEFEQLLQKLSINILQVNHVYTMGFAVRLRRGLIRAGNKAPIILETHDVQAHLLHEKGEASPWTNRPDQLEKLIESEIALSNKADVLVHLSVDDYKFFQGQLPARPHILAMPTIDETFVSRVKATKPPGEKIDLLFVGQSHFPNVAAIKWFFEEVQPLIADRQYNLKIVGPVVILVRDRLPQIYDDFRSCFVGEVADLAPYYSAARCVIAPMVSGTGTSIKTIEALALGKPFVGTSKAFRGMPLERLKEAGVGVHDEPQDFADAIVRALSSEEESRATSRAAYDSVFSLKAAFASRDEAVRIATNATRV
jgi:glycosyltransferase involved in cell wall biosynthesis